MLDIDHRDRRQLGHLMASRTPRRRLLPVAELVPAAPARVGVVIDDLRHLILAEQLAPRPLMSGLAARLAPGTLHQQLLRLRPSLRATLLTRLWRILRRRAGARTRIYPRLLLKAAHPLLQPRVSSTQLIKRTRQLQDELDTALPPTVKDRLRLRALHNAKIRHPPSRPLVMETND
jgi:hypothetical protein